MAKKAKKKDTNANLGFEAKLWLAADKLRNNMDAAEYKHVVLGLIFLKYISDSFDEQHAKLVAGEGEYEGADPEDPDEYRAENVFWVPLEARWQTLQDSAKQPTIGKLIDDAMDAIERDNPKLKGILPKDYARPALDKQRVGELIDLIGTIQLVVPASTDEDPNLFDGPAEARAAHRSKDILGRVYEYFLTRFASAEGKNGGQFYTPACVVRTLVEMLAPYNGRIYDPACGSGGMFVQADKFIKAHVSGNGNQKSGVGFQPAKADIAIYGQESNPTTRRLAMMNLAIRGIDGDLGKEHADTFRRDLHKDLKADYVIANPPFNDSDWHRNEEDVRWKYGTPPKGNANFAWVQHFIHHLSPTGTAGFVLANGSMSSNQSGEGDIRRQIIDADLVDCMVAMPGQLFYSTQIPVCLWFLTRDKSGKVSKRGLAQAKRSGDVPVPSLRDRTGETLFIDARKMGTLIDRVHRELTDADIARIADTYHAWQGNVGVQALACGTAKDDSLKAELQPYSDIPGFCKSATQSEIAEHGHVLTPGRYVGAEEVEDDGEPFEDKMRRLVGELGGQFEESSRLEEAIKSNLEALGYGG